MAKCPLVFLAFMAAYVSAQSYGIVGNDIGNDPPYLQSHAVGTGPKQGGTPITIQGAGFRDDKRLMCRFSRLNPETETTLTKYTTGTYVSPTEMVCDSPAWDEGPCPTCISSAPLSGNFFGYTGSPYLRSDSTNVPNEVGVGDYIHLNAAETPSGKLISGGQFYQIKHIEGCTATAGCVCGANHGGYWGPSDMATVEKGYNSTSHPHWTTINKNCLLYRYDYYKPLGIPCNTTNGEPTCWSIPNPTTGTPGSAVAWQAGTKITLAEPIYRIDGYPNVNIVKNKTTSGYVKAYRSSKWACTGCKCDEGCPVTLSVTNDGSIYSGNGINGKSWTGSTLSFTIKDIVPTVHYISNGLTPRDSTRQYGPATGGTVITVVGKNFQNSPQLRCYFAQNKILSQAQWISDTMITCKTPPFFAFLDDGDTGNLGAIAATTDANYDGSAMNPHTKVHVTNDGMINDDIEGSRLSQNPHKQDDGSFSYIHGVPAQRWKQTTATLQATALSTVKNTLTDIDPVTPGTGNTAYTAAPAGKKCTGAGRLGTLTFSSLVAAQAGCNQFWDCHGVSQNGAGASAVYWLCNAASTWVADAAMTCTTASADHHKCIWRRDVPTTTTSWYEPLDTYNDGFNPYNPFRSTCMEGIFPQENMGPCYNAGLAGSSEGNDVLFKYATCYESQKAGEYEDGASHASFDYYPTGTPTAGSELLTMGTAMVQRFQIAKSLNLEGPLSHIQLYLTKASSEVQELEVNITANGGNLPAASATAVTGGTVLASVKIHVHRITGTGNKYFNVFFPTAPYLMPDRYYDLTVRRLSGAADIRWHHSTPKPSGSFVYVNGTSQTWGFNVRGYTCDGCRERMTFTPSITPYNDYAFGAIPVAIRTDETNNANAGTGHNPVHDAVTSTTTTPAGTTTPTASDSWFSSVVSGPTDDMHAYSNPAGAYRSMMAQEFRPKETGTITHVKLKLKTHEIYYGRKAEKKAMISVWITEHGKYGEYVCNSFGGNQIGNMCDASMNGQFNEACALGTVCNPYNGLNGGCGDRGACSLATTVTNAHRLRPESGDPAQGPCSYDSKCSDTMSLNPDHQKVLADVDNAAASSWTVFEFKAPVPVTKHTTYYFNAAVVGDAMESGSVTWYSAKAETDNTQVAKPAGANSVAAPKELWNRGYGAFYRDPQTWNWAKVAEKTTSPGPPPVTKAVVLAISFIRCVTSTSNVMGFSTTGDKTGCCSARASPQGGDKGATVTVTGRNFFPSDHLRCVFRNEDGTAGQRTQATVTKGDYTEATCPAPTHSPHSTRDCTNPALCQGVELLMTHDGLNVGPQYMGPKWSNACPTTLGSTCTQTAATTALPAYSGQNPLKFLFSEIYISTGSGSDTTGDGTLARPYATIQRGLDAANENDQILLEVGTYTGLGNRGLRHHGKHVQLRSKNGDRSNTIIDCQMAPDGFILNNNKDSDSPFAGYVDTQDIITKNCENLRIYDI
jgi:hypothetical protein